jgi:hypothetical protein
MKARVEVVSLNTDGEEQRRQILTIERRDLAMETLGVNLTERFAVLTRPYGCPSDRGSSQPAMR